MRHRDDLTFEEVVPAITSEVGTGLSFVACDWFSTYRIHHRCAEEDFVRVLAEHQDVGVRAEALADVTKRYPGLVSALGPHVHAASLPAEREGALGDPELRVDFEGACLHRHRPRLLRGTAVAVDDPRVDATSTQLVGKHQAGGTGADDKDIDIHEQSA